MRSIPGVSLGDEKDFPGWVSPSAGCAFLIGQWLAWGELHNAGILYQYESQ